MLNIAKSFVMRGCQHLSIFILLVPASHVLAGDCGCEVAHACHHHHHCCCPPGLLARLNDLSDAVESNLKALVPIRHKGCDHSSCDHCDSATFSAPVSQETSEPHTHPVWAVESEDETDLRFDEKPTSIKLPPTTPSTSKSPASKSVPALKPVPATPRPTESPRIPDWLRDPFQDDVLSAPQPLKIQPASAKKRPEQVEDSILIFDPQASSRRTSAVEQLLIIAAKKPNVSNTANSVKSSSLERVTKFERPSVRAHLRDVQGKMEPVDSEVRQAGAFVPVHVAPIPRLK